MISEPPDYDPITVWQNQKEHSAPSLEQILMRANKFKAKNRRGAFIFGLAFGLHLAVSVAQDAAGMRGIWWVGIIQFALLIVWVYYIPFKTSGADNLSPLSLRTAAMTPVFDFYRRQLEKHRDYLRDDTRGVVQLVIIGIAFALNSLLYPSLFLIFGIPLAVCAAVFYKRRRAELPRIQHELEILDRLRKERL